MPDPDLPGLFAELETEYVRLRDLLADRDVSALRERPPDGKWSVLENLQHLAFTGFVHLGHLAPEERGWAPYGLVQVQPRSEKQLRLTAGGTTEDLVAAWTAGHAVLVARVEEQDSLDVRHRVARHIKHQRQHIDEIQRLTRRMDRASRSPG